MSEMHMQAMATVLASVPVTPVTIERMHACLAFGDLKFRNKY